MSHSIHNDHDHVHTSGCGHTRIKHEDHIDYLHDGHLHHPHEDHIDEHSIATEGNNPVRCQKPTESHQGHVHGDNCGHEKVPHGDHYDYIVDGVLHHYHQDHCDDHGPIEVVA